MYRIFTTRGGEKEMKKTCVVLIMLVGSIAFASSLSIPWYVDSIITNIGLPPSTDGNLALLYLKSTVDHPLTCTIAYYNADGAYLGPNPDFTDVTTGKPYVNTFAIAAKAAVGFRPVADDPISGLTSPWGPNGVGAVGTLGGQESAAGVKIPNRPRSVNGQAIPGSNPSVVDIKKNGSITISWSGDATDLQGSQQSWAKGSGTLVSFSHLLPPGK
jgi:hypothetical protein